MSITNQLKPISQHCNPQRILLINNHDSFVYNLVNGICSISDAEVRIVDNTISIEEINNYHPDKILLSPGPGHPKYDSGNMIAIIQHFGKRIPILGVCLGHQAITEAFGEDPHQEYVGKFHGGPKHGIISEIFHNNTDLFRNIPNPCSVVRYHSLASKADLLPSCLQITAMADDGCIMAIQHRQHNIFGVQFHPESIMMHPQGLQIILNFLQLPDNQKVDKNVS